MSSSAAPASLKVNDTPVSDEGCTEKGAVHRKAAPAIEAMMLRIFIKLSLSDYESYRMFRKMRTQKRAGPLLQPSDDKQKATSYKKPFLANRPRREEGRPLRTSCAEQDQYLYPSNR